MYTWKLPVGLICLASALPVGCGNSNAPPSIAPSPASTSLAARQGNAAERKSSLGAVQGTWVGEYKLWFKDPNKPEISEGTLTVDGARIEYTWAFRGKPQTGTLDVEANEGAVKTRWTDTWHSPTELVSSGTLRGGIINTLGSYGVGDGPDWGWRTELEVGDHDRFVLRMYNIPPGGREVHAVELVCKRAP